MRPFDHRRRNPYSGGCAQYLQMHRTTLAPDGDLTVALRAGFVTTTPPEADKAAAGVVVLLCRNLPAQQKTPYSLCLGASSEAPRQRDKRVVNLITVEHKQFCALHSNLTRSLSCGYWSPAGRDTSAVTW